MWRDDGEDGAVYGALTRALGRAEPGTLAQEERLGAV